MTGSAVVADVGGLVLRRNAGAAQACLGYVIAALLLLWFAVCCGVGPLSTLVEEASPPSTCVEELIPRRFARTLRRGRTLLRAT